MFSFDFLTWIFFRYHHLCVFSHEFAIFSSLWKFSWAFNGYRRSKWRGWSGRTMSFTSPFPKEKCKIMLIYLFIMNAIFYTFFYLQNFRFEIWSSMTPLKACLKGLVILRWFARTRHWPSPHYYFLQKRHTCSKALWNLYHHPLTSPLHHENRPVVNSLA